MFQFNNLSANLDVPESHKNNKINRIHERWIRLLYNDKKSSFIYHRNLRALATEMDRIYKNFSLSPQALPNVRTINNGIESTKYLGLGKYSSKYKRSRHNRSF